MKESIINKKMDHIININNFEGPLDVLLYLICKNKMDIFELSLSELTDEYIEYLSNMEKMNIEIASEFIVMASMLIEIKSRKLLPAISDDDENEDVTEEEIMTKLIEYKKYKELSENISSLYKNNFGSFAKSFENINFNKSKQYKGQKFDKNDLRGIYIDVILRNKNKINSKAREIEKIALYERITVKDKTREMVNFLRNNESFIFNNMFSIENKDKIEVVTAFLGALELSKEKQVTISQNELFSDIYVKRNKDLINFEF